MKQLAQHQYESVRHLFSDDFPNIAIILAIIEQVIPGQIWVNHEEEPSICLIVTHVTYCFLKGDINEEEFAECMQILKQKQTVKLFFEPDPQFDLAKLGFVPLLRRQYRYKNIHHNMPIFENNSGYLLKKIEDLETFDLCLWKPLLIGFFGTAENFLKNGIGYILWDAQHKIIASEAYGIPSKKFVEVGTITHELYRGKKLSTILCNHLIRNAIQKGLQPIWTCDDANLFSWKVAEKQGMDEKIQYIFYTWVSS